MSGSLHGTLLMQFLLNCTVYSYTAEGTLLTIILTRGSLLAYFFIQGWLCFNLNYPSVWTLKQISQLIMQIKIF